jgi:glutathione S-transferase
MYTLYWSHNSASIAPHYCLEEAGAPYDLVLVDMAKDDHKKAAFLKVNPIGKLPAFKLPNGEIIIESAGICMLINDLHPDAKLGPKAGDPKRGAFYMWLCHLTNTLQPAMLRYYYPHRITKDEAGIEGVKAAAMEEVAAIWTRIDAHLAAGGPYLLGADFSAADAFAYMLSTWQECCPGIYQRFPNVKCLAELVRARPAIMRIADLNQVSPVAA